MIKFKKYLKDLTPYPPGKTIDELKRELGIKGKIYKFNSNENPLGPPESVKKFIKEIAESVHLYPEASYVELKKKVADLWDVKSSQVVLGNGSDEVLEFVFKALINPGDEIIVSQPSFLMYEKFGEIYGASIKKIPLTSTLKHDFEKILNEVSSNTKVIFLDHPHNPTGQVLKRKEWESFLKNIPRDILVVIDEAYGDFIEDADVPLGVEFLKEGYTILVVRTLSKSYGLAGLRIGYGVTRPEIAEVLDAVRQPFNLNLIAYKAGIVALEDKEYLKKSRKLVFEGRRYLTRELESMGFKVLPSQANFIMVNFGDKAELIYKELLKKGVLVRPLKAYGFGSYLRISIGLMEDNQYLIKCIKEVLKGGKGES